MWNTSFQGEKDELGAMAIFSLNIMGIQIDFFFRELLEI